MPDKNKKDSDQLEIVDAPTELEQLRHIIFGEAQSRLANQITTLRSDLEKALLCHQQEFTNKLASLKDDTESKFVQMDKKLQLIDSTHEDNESNLQKSLDNLTSEHEMFATATQQDFKSIEQSLDNESTSLVNNFNEQLEQLKSHLEHVSKDLTSSKTDRKTLARLLATMATNLQDEPL